MVSTQGYSSYLIPYLFSSSLSQTSSSQSANSLTQLALYNSPSLLQAYAKSQTSGLQQGGQVTQQVSSVWNNFNSLNTLAKTFTATDTTSVFSQRTVSSSDTAAVTGTVSGGAAQASYSVGVSQLAVAQQNSGTALLSSGNNLSAGVTTSATYSFKLTTNAGTQQSYYVNVKSGDQNQQVLQKMADAINTASSAGTAVAKAQVVSSVSGGVQSSKLVVTAANTGTDNGFTLSDITGNLTAASGAGTAAVAAQNASYTVNGVTNTSQSNTAVIKNTGVTLNLLKPTSKAATLTVGLDVTGISKQMSAFVAQYNSTIGALHDSGLFTASKLTSRLGDSFSSEASDLESIGLTVNQDKTLSFNPDTFEQALTANPNKVSSLLSGYGKLASAVQSVAQNVTALAPSWLASTQNLYPGTDTSQTPSVQFQQYVQNAVFGMFAGSSGTILNIAA